VSALAPDHAFGPIVVSEHAALRARERFRVEPEVVEAEVRDALLFDRVCDHTPSWMAGRDHGEPVVWTRERDRIYVLSLSPGCVHVKTALSHCRPGR
jgi:hypothetical protein